MTESMNLITAQISFLEPHLALIHIPIELYPVFLQPIFRLLFGEDHDEDAARISWTNRHDFLNVTLTPVECSVICSKQLADRYFRPLLQFYGSVSRLQSISGDDVEIGHEDYCVIQVDGQGLDAGQRVLDLTSPLAMAGISIFFITTYFCDYILVPSRSRRMVMTALQQQGFVFSHSADAFVSQLSPSSPTVSHQSHGWLSSPVVDPNIPTTPPAKDIPELQTRTFTKLKRKNIKPVVDSSIRLLNCAGNRDSAADADERLKNDLMQVLLSTSPAEMKSKTPDDTAVAGLGLDMPAVENGHSPVLDFSTRFLSVTITAAEPISIFLEQKLLDRLGSSLMGIKEAEDALMPITLDLRDLPMEATGIVCGVAGRLAQGTKALLSQELGVSPKSGKQDGTGSELHGTGDGEGGPVEITFLSTAKAGTVLVRASQLEQALEALEFGMNEVAQAG